MIIKPNDKYIRYTGRWKVDEESAVSSANGNYFEFSYVGSMAVIAFDTRLIQKPSPHIYISVDNGAKIALPVDEYVRISGEEGTHHVKVIMKSSDERQNRWHTPIASACIFLGIEADGFCELEEDKRKKIEFIGDSITEGISIDVENESYYGNESSMSFWDDSTAGYAWLTAEALNFRPYIMGYGCLGTTKSGGGDVPKVAESYPCYSDGNPMESIGADYIVINHGTNDRRATKEVFKAEYTNFLKIVRNRNKNSRIIALTPFSGCLAKEIQECVENHNKAMDDDIFYIDSTGWISAEPIHPDREGHKTVCKHLVEIFKNEIL